MMNETPTFNLKLIINFFMTSMVLMGESTECMKKSSYEEQNLYFMALKSNFADSWFYLYNIIQS